VVGRYWFVFGGDCFGSLRAAHIPTGDRQGLGRCRPGGVGYAGRGSEPSSKAIRTSEYYAIKVENLRTYPVYAPGREPEGYWKKLQELGPQPLIDTGELKTEVDWISAGKRVFAYSERCRSAFRTDGDHDSKLMPITIPK
jgi:hypothetical protein